MLNKIAALVFILTVTAASAAETQFARLEGRVLDPDRAAIGGATISVEAGSVKRTAVTDEDGSFVLSLPPADYSLTVEAPGFQTTAKPVRLISGAHESLEIVLPVAGSTATVTIIASEGIGYRADAISSSTKTLTDLRDTPQSITVLPKERLRDQALTSIADVLNYVPGMMSHQGENNRDQFVIRGVSSSADFFLNGVRDDVQYLRDLYNVQRVEILKGPNAMIFGRGGGGGVVNRVAREPQSSPLREFTFQGGSFRNRRFTADINQPLSKTIAARVNGVYEGANSFRDFVNRKRYGINPTLTYSPSSATQITFGYEHFYDSRTADRGIPSFDGRPADLPIETYFGNPNDAYARVRVNLLSGTVQHQLGRLNIRNRTLFGDYDRAYQNYVPGAVNATKTLVALTAYNNATKRRNLFNQTDVTLYATTGRFKHTILTGAEFGRQLTDNFRNTGFFNNSTTTIQVPFDDPVISTPITFRQSATDADNHLKTNLAAAYLQDQIEISRHVQIVAGLRFDYFDLNFHNKRNGENLRRVDRLLSPRFGIVYKPISSLSLYATHSVSYLPSSGDQFSSLTTVTQQVKPERFSNYEFGSKWDLRRNLTLTAAIYRQDRTNTRATDPNDPTRIIQTGRQRTDGFEVELSGAVTRAWTITGGYAHQNARVTSATTAAPAGAVVPLAPRDMLTLWNKYQVTSRFGLGLGIAHRTEVFAAIDNKVVLPGFTKVDAAAYFRLAEKWKLQVHLDNLLNRRYYLNADGNNNITPGAPRSAKVSLVAVF
ncbi:MAG TPA: TonB-dependent siderophore receptor [Pyrinomonadaceae bacterium]|nr:TonB-dependent siderophore receptor [Pyrinomonadaceae bacterium]